MSCDLSTIKTNQIRRYRKKRYLRQQDVSRMLGLKQSCDVYRWEAGRQVPSLMNALKLSAALGCPVELLFLDHFQRIRGDMYPQEAEK